jgi:hypothetical protein
LIQDPLALELLEGRFCAGDRIVAEPDGKRIALRRDGETAAVSM